MNSVNHLKGVYKFLKFLIKNEMKLNDEDLREIEGQGHK